jgi:hypothetical protein
MLNWAYEKLAGGEYGCRRKNQPVMRLYAEKYPSRASPMRVVPA